MELAKRDHRYFAGRVLRAMEKRGLDAAFFVTPENMYYASGYLSVNFQDRSGVGSEVCLMGADSERPHIFLSQFYQGGAEMQTEGTADVTGYPVWIFIEDYFDPKEGKKEVQPDPVKALRLAADKAGGAKRVGIERSALSHDAYVFLASRYGEENLVDLSEMMIELRMIKTPWEVEMIRRSGAVAHGMAMNVIKKAEIGMTEADLRTLWYTAAYELTGSRDLVFVTQYHTSGPHFWCSAPARTRPFEAGDIVRLDGGVNLGGYFSDIARTFAFGDSVAPERQRIYDTLLAAHDRAIEVCRPGNKASDIFHAVMKVCHDGALPHFIRGHVGHSNSLGPGEEYPMLSPDNDMILQPGMVFCLETPYYSSRFGSYNIEDMVAITETGNDCLTVSPRSLFIKE